MSQKQVDETSYEPTPRLTLVMGGSRGWVDREHRSGLCWHPGSVRKRERGHADPAQS
jgi:hypothetical protein